MIRVKGFLSNRNKTLILTHLPYLTILFAVIFISLFIFSPPMPGVADQGDFERIMSVTGLEYVATNSEEFNSHWFKYVVTNYKMNPLDLYRLNGAVPTTSMIYPIAVTRVLCEMVNGDIFSTQMLAVVYLTIYIFAFYCCIKNIKFSNTALLAFFCILSIFILFDGNYLVWFNSLYGEPMMISSFLLFIATVLFVINGVNKSELAATCLVFASSWLFIGSKLQCFTALPLIIFIIIRTSIRRRFIHKKGYTGAFNKAAVCILIILITRYVYGIYNYSNSRLGSDTAYNSVFYGILKNADNPEKSLEELGLSKDLAVDAGKHAYLKTEDYARYVPESDLTKREFNNKISNLKILTYYVKHPSLLLKGMEYTAQHSLDTNTYLGKYEKSEVSSYTYDFNVFTYWSKFRNKAFPKNLYFIGTFYLIVFITSLREYIRAKKMSAERYRVELLWIIAATGILQFPMPFIGNGEADTAKQLFLFNYTFDIVILIGLTWLFNKIINLIKLR